MMDYLKPNKANVGGTIIILVANWISGLVARNVVPLLIGTTSGGYGQGGQFQGQTMRSGFGSAGWAIGLVLSAVLFYIGISITIGFLSKLNNDANKQ